MFIVSMEGNKSGFGVCLLVACMTAFMRIKGYRTDGWIDIPDRRTKQIKAKQSKAKQITTRQYLHLNSPISAPALSLTTLSPSLYSVLI